MNLLRREKCIVEIIRIPDTATDENKNVVIPPRTEEGIATRAAATLENMPSRRRNTQAA